MINKVISALLLGVSDVSAQISCRGKIVHKKDANVEFTIPID